MLRPRTMDTILTPRLELRPITLPLVIALMDGRRSEIEKLVGAEMPWTWPSRALVEQVFEASLEAVRADPDTRLWGDRLMVTREDRPRVIGSVVFHGRPDGAGVCEVGYGVEDTSQGKGYASEALAACIAWALDQPECKTVRARTTAWHKASSRLVEKVGMKLVSEEPIAGTKDTMRLYEIARP